MSETLRRCYDCRDYRYEGYIDPIDNQFFCDYCQKQRMKDYQGGEEWTAIGKESDICGDNRYVGSPVCD
jgi:hypothetical protein